MANKKRKSNCPINFALELFGDRWTLLIIRDLMFNGKHYYGEFLQSEEKIATNILADRLALLEQSEIVIKTVDTVNKSKYVYRLSPKGIDLLPILIEVMLWSAKYDEHTFIDANFVRSATQERTKVLEEISNRLISELS